MQRFYKAFVERVAAGRKRPFDVIEPLARGRVWTGRRAVENGLADRLGTLDDAIGRLRGLDRKALGSMMKDALRRDPPEGSRGASVGWITVAREATGGFDYGFYPLSGTDKTYFTFRADFE